MSVFKDSIRDFETFEEHKLVCSGIYGDYGRAIKKIADLDESNMHFRIHYPVANFKTYFDLDIDFNPYDEHTYCYYEKKLDHVNNCIYVKPYILKIYNNDREFDFKIAPKLLKGKVFIGPDRFTIFTNLEKISENSSYTSYISDVRNGEITSIRYLPDPDAFLEQLDSDKLKEKLLDCYKTLLADINDFNIIKYEILIDNNINDITELILIPFISKLIIAPNTLYNVLMNPSINIDKYEEDFMSYLGITDNKLLMLHAIKEFRNLVKYYVGENTYMGNGIASSKPCQLAPSNKLVLWEIIKFIRYHFKTIYTNLKKMDTITVHKQKNTICQITDDDDNDGSYFHNIFDDISTTYQSKSVAKCRTFNPQPYNDYYEFNSKKIKLDTSSNNIKYLEQYIDVINNSQRNKMLTHMEKSLDYKIYKQLLPNIEFRPLFVTKKIENH